MKKSRFTDSQIMAALKRVEVGLAVPEICRELGISTATFYKWRAKFGGMDTSMMSRMKELEDENRRLKKMYLEEKLKSSRCRGPRKKVVRPSRRCAMAQRAVLMRSVPIRVACAAFMVSESCYRYEPKQDAENALIADWLIRLTDNHRT